MPAGVNSKWQLKQPLPALNIARSLSRMLNIAVSAGWEKGFTNDNQQGAPRSPGAGQFGTAAAPIAGRATWENGVEAAEYPSPFEKYGRAVYKGTLVNVSYRFTNLQTFPPIISYETQYGLTVALLWRTIATQSADQPIIARRVSPYGATNGGWSIHCQAGNTYEARISDGATQVAARSTTAQATDRVDLIVFTYDRSNLRLFVNGVLEATTATSITVQNVNRSIRIWGQASGDGVLGMMAMWNRALANSELAALYSDPFVMWRTGMNEEDVEAEAVYNTFLAAF